MKHCLLRYLAAASGLAALISLGSAPEPLDLPTEKRLPLIRFVEPEFPAGIQFHGITSGYAHLAITVDSSGKVIDAFPTEFSHRRFVDSSLAAISLWQFEPSADAADLPRFFPIRFNYHVEGLVLIMTTVEDSLMRHERLLNGSPAQRSFSIERLDRIPETRNAPMPVYPDELKPLRKSGFVEVQFYIDKSGKVRAPFVKQSDHPLFAQAALKAVEGWSFEPPVRKGREVSAFAVQEFSFGPRTSLN